MARVGRAGHPPEVRAQVEELESAGVSRGEISRTTGVTQTTLRKWLGNKSSVVYRHPPEVRARIKKLVDDGWPYARIERNTGIRQATLTRWFGPSKHSAHDMTYAWEARRKLAEWRYKEMVRMRMKGGMTNQEIAEALGMSAEGVRYHIGSTPERLGGAKKYPIGYPDRARYLKEAGYSISQIGEELDVPRSTVGGWVQGMPCG
jgi:transposase-like protein